MSHRWIGDLYTKFTMFIPLIPRPELSPFLLEFLFVRRRDCGTNGRTAKGKDYSIFVNLSRTWEIRDVGVSTSPHDSLYLRFV